MKKTAIIGIISVLMFAQNSFAFGYSGDLQNQIGEYSGTVLNSTENLVLATSQSKIRSLDASPNYVNDKLIYLSTQDGVYLNRSFDANFIVDENLSLYFPNGLKKIQFEGSYKNNGMMLAYDSEKIYISYNFGNSWSEVLLDIEEEIMEADFGPKFETDRKIFFVTKSGLYRKNLSNENVDLILAADTEGEIKNFRYVRTQQTDLVYFVVKGDTLYKTENYGSSWVKEQFDSKIKDFEIKQKTLNEGDFMVLTEDNDVYYSNWQMNFFELEMPSEINAIFAIDYLILTDQGFYISYNNAASWTKLNYSNLNPSLISDYDFVISGSQTMFFITYGNVLKRDLSLSETFNDYMGGLSLSSGYASSGTAVSKNILDLHTEKFAEEYKVGSATLEADGDLNGGTMNFYMTADGENWEAVELGVKHAFATPGRDLRWKVEMSTSDTSKTPVLRSVSVNFGMDSGCAGFEDVAVDDPYCPAIGYVRAQGIFSGYPDGTFGADLEINRAETVKVITEGFDYAILKDNGTNLGFSDVEVGSWYMGYLNTAKTAGIIEGYPDGTFKPGKTVNYVEMMKIFLETADAELVEPATGSAWYQKYVNYATENGLTVYENLDAGMKRGDVAKLFYDWSKL